MEGCAYDLTNDGFFHSPNSLTREQPKLNELWGKYSQFKKTQISPSTYAKGFTRHCNYIERLPSHQLEDAALIQDYLLANLKPDAAEDEDVNPFTKAERV